MKNMYEGIDNAVDMQEILKGPDTRTLYDVKRKTVTFADGVDSVTWKVVDIRRIEVQPIRFSAERSATIVTVNLGGESYIPSYRGFCDIDCDITASDRITANSGTTDLLVLRTYEFPNHQEIDLREVSD